MRREEIENSKKKKHDDGVRAPDDDDQSNFSIEDKIIRDAEFSEMVFREFLDSDSEEEEEEAPQNNRAMLINSLRTDSLARQNMSNSQIGKHTQRPPNDNS